MKVLSSPEGDSLLTNAEVLQWLREKKFEAPKSERPPDSIKPSRNLIGLVKDMREYLEQSPAGNQTVQSTKKLFEKLKKFNLSSPELLMIANIRPEAYAHIVPLIVDIHNRFDEHQVYEMLEIVKATLEPRPSTEGEEDEDEDEDENAEQGADAGEDAGAEEDAVAEYDVGATEEAVDMGDAGEDMDNPEVSGQEQDASLVNGELDSNLAEGKTEPVEND